MYLPNESGFSADATARTLHGPSAEEVLQHSGYAVLTLDREYRLTYANAEAIRLSRLSLPADLGRDIRAMRPEFADTDIGRRLIAAMEDRVAADFTFENQQHQAWVEVRLQPIEAGVAVYYRNVTQATLGEQERQRAESRFQQLFEAVPDAVVVIDANWRFTYANSHSIDLLGVGREFLGQDIFKFFPGNLSEPFQSNYRKVMAERVAVNFEAYQGATLHRWFEVRVRPFEEGIVVFFSDITSRKEAECARDIAGRQLREVFDATAESIVGIDRDWKCTFANRRAMELLGTEDLVGKDLWTSFPGNQLRPFASNYRRAMEERVRADFEAHYDTPPLDLWFRVTARPYDGGIIISSDDITARKHAEIARDRAARELQQVMDVTEEGVVALDRSYTIRFLNKRAREIYSPVGGDVTGQNLWEVFADADPLFRRHYDTAMLERRPVHFDAFYPEPLNLWFAVDAFPSEDGIVIFFRDVTQQHRDEQELRASEERYRVLADLNPQFIWMGSPDGQITYANQGFADYIGSEFSPQFGTRWLEAFVPEDRERVVAAWAHSAATGEVFEVDARLVRAADGEARWFQLRALPVRGEAGMVLHWLGVAIDIHESRTFAERLEREKQITEQRSAELEAIYNASPVGLGLFDPVEFRYLRVSDRLAEIIGLPKEQILGKRITDVAGKVEAIEQLFETVASGIPVVNQISEGELPGQPGVRRAFNLNYFPVLDDEGKVTAITTASLDITKQRRTESALIQSEKLAAVGRLASSISHEINNPLEAITNLLYLIAMNPDLPADLRAYVSMTQAEVARVSQIATQTLRFHRQAVRPTHVPPRELLDAVLNLYQGRLANSGIQVERRYVTETPVFCFENDIRQVLNNLIANAIDAMRSGGRLVIRAHDATLTDAEHPMGRHGVRLTVADTGHGMSEEIRRRVFEPFYTTKELNGTGLGLWISTGIVERHQGRLTVRSSTDAVHHGTVFSLFLPLEVIPTQQ